MQQKLTVFFSDIANSTWLYQHNGDVVAHRMVSECLADLRVTVESHRGQLLRTVGDAVLASFESSSDAMSAAIACQRGQLQSPLKIRIGFHYGEVIPDGGDLYGNAVNIAARVASFSNAEEIYTTQETVEQLPPEFKDKTLFLDSISFKGIQTPLPVYRVRWFDQPASPTTRIITQATRAGEVRPDTVLQLLIGARHLRVDEFNPRVQIGRDFDNDIIIDHDSASRHHAVIEYQRGRYSLTDMSTNGTYVVLPGRNAVFLRRESIALDNDGIIGAGWHPVVQDDAKIAFRSVRVQNLSE